MAKRRYLTGGTRVKLLGLLADLFSGALAQKWPTRRISRHERHIEIKGLPLAGQMRTWRSAEACSELPAVLLELLELAGPSDAATGGAPAEPSLGRPSNSGGGLVGAAGPSAVEALPVEAALSPATRHAWADQLASLLLELDGVAAASHDKRLGKTLVHMAAAEAAVAGIVATEADTAIHSSETSRPSLQGPLDNLRDLRRWLRQSAAQVAVAPAQAYIQALSSPPDSYPDRAVKALQAGAAGSLRGCWKRISHDRPAAFDRCTAVLEGHTKFVRSVAFSPDRATLASGSNDWTVRLWAAATGELLQVG